MYITRKRLRKLINEALKPFFMGVPPTDIIERLIQDPDINPKIKNLLKDPNQEMQRQAINLLQSIDPTIGTRYPELNDYNITDPVAAPDITQRSQANYKKEFESAQLRAVDLAYKQQDLAYKQQIDQMTSGHEKAAFVEKIAKETFSTVHTQTHDNNPTGYLTLILKIDDTLAIEQGIKTPDPSESESFIQRMRNLGLYDTIYLQRPHEIMLTFEH